MTICLSHGGDTITAAHSPSNDLLVATADGLLSMKRAAPGKDWGVDKRWLQGHHVNAILIEPQSGTIFAGMHNGGVAASKDFGESWEFRNNGIASDNVYSLASAKSGGKTKVYAGTEPAHLYVSEDMGASWRELPALRSVPSLPKWTFPGPPHIAHVKDITFDPRDAETIYASVEQGGVLRSKDAGATFEEITGWMYLTGSYNDDPHRLMIRPSQPGTMFIPTGFGMYRTKDGGDKWEDVSRGIPGIGYPDLFVYDPRDDSLMFVAGGEMNPGEWMRAIDVRPKVARSRDGGETWEVLPGPGAGLHGNFEAMSIEAWDGGSAIYIGDTDGDIYCSEDEGDSWGKIATGLPAISKGGHYQVLALAASRR